MSVPGSAEAAPLNPDALRCAQCHAPLPSPTAICAACEAEDAARLPVGACACPTCRGRFDRPTLVHLPKDAPCWQPRATRLACPHCAQVLLDRAREPVSPWPLVVLLAAVTAGVRMLPSGPWQNIFVLSAAAVYALAWAWATRKLRRAPDRYVPRPPEADIAWTGAWMARRLLVAWQRVRPGPSQR